MLKVKVQQGTKVSSLMRAIDQRLKVPPFIVIARHTLIVIVRRKVPKQSIYKFLSLVSQQYVILALKRGGTDRVSLGLRKPSSSVVVSLQFSRSPNSCVGHMKYVSPNRSARTGQTREKEFFVHQTSIIEEPCQIGKGTKIWHFCHVMPGVTIGRNCVIGQNVFIGKGVRIGNNVKIENNVSIYEGGDPGG